MSRYIQLWDKIPIIIRAIIIGFLVSAAGTTPWAVLVSLNLKFGSIFPWAVIITGIYLWFYWRYLQGAWWPKSTTEIRKKNCRANPMSDQVWGAAILAGISGLVFIVLFQAVLSRIVRLPTQAVQDLSHIPLLTLFCFVIMSGVVAGVAEEAGFRGYMQRPIEKRYGPVTAILVVGIVFGFAHFSHAEVTLVFIPYYITVSAVYGMLAYLTDSILPSMVLHTAGNILSSVGLLMQNNTQTHISPSPVKLIWESGADKEFWITSGAAFLTGAFVIWAYKILAAAVKKT